MELKVERILVIEHLAKATYNFKPIYVTEGSQID